MRISHPRLTDWKLRLAILALCSAGLAPLTSCGGAEDETSLGASEDDLSVSEDVFDLTLSASVSGVCLFADDVEAQIRVCDLPKDGCTNYQKRVFIAQKGTILVPETVQKLSLKRNAEVCFRLLSDGHQFPIQARTENDACYRYTNGDWRNVSSKVGAKLLTDQTTFTASSRSLLKNKVGCHAVTFKWKAKFLYTWGDLVWP
jgi:hypothetical protein